MRHIPQKFDDKESGTNYENNSPWLFCFCDSVIYKRNFSIQNTAGGASEEAKAAEEDEKEAKAAVARAEAASKEAKEAEDRARLAADRLEAAEQKLKVKERAAQVELCERIWFSYLCLVLFAYWSK